MNLAHLHAFSGSPEHYAVYFRRFKTSSASCGENIEANATVLCDAFVHACCQTKFSQNVKCVCSGWRLIHGSAKKMGWAGKSKGHRKHHNYLCW